MKYYLVALFDEDSYKNFTPIQKNYLNVLGRIGIPYSLCTLRGSGES